ncbi:hypothetical protein [Phormidium sp. CCY1219]|uniref:hypothetical protein n=1 Tax=Phormidium sp. CCY1219 TaxID=2886104 RepID=UPI002D1F049E|nr:hypothetical protein [Phormidium sp. CCY1219]MEB3826718.1 hypothetical protein [Phormidium sp. CCY1219]
MVLMVCYGNFSAFCYSGGGLIDRCCSPIDPVFQPAIGQWLRSPTTVDAPTVAGHFLGCVSGIPLG